MPQEFQVLQCYSCNTFQVDIVKKQPKWQCKMCREKQSVRQIFLRGTSKDCRLLVQDNNAKRLLYKETLDINIASTVNQTDKDQVHLDVQDGNISKWSEFFPKSNNYSRSNNDVSAIDNFSSDRAVKRQKVRETCSSDSVETSQNFCQQNVVEHGLDLKNYVQYIPTNNSPIFDERHHQSAVGSFQQEDVSKQFSSSSSCRNDIHNDREECDSQPRTHIKIISKSVFEDGDNVDFLDDFL